MGAAVQNGSVPAPTLCGAGDVEGLVRWRTLLPTHVENEAERAGSGRRGCSRVRWLLGLLRDWRLRRAVRRDHERRIAAWKALPADQVGYVHPASPQKPPGWTAAKYRAAQRRRDGAN
jgi:hypothetical protein